MHLGIRAHGPVSINFFQREFGFGALLDFLGIANVVIGLKGLWDKPPKLRRSLGFTLASDHNEKFHQHGHFAGVFAGGLGSAFKLTLVLFPGFGIGDQSIAVLSGAAHRLGAVGCHQQRNRFRGTVVEPGIHVVVLAFVFDRFAAPKLANEFGGFDKALGTLLPLGPGADGSLLIERFSGADA